jgi:hypothetical protein
VKYVSIGYFRHHPQVSYIQEAETLGKGLLNSVKSEADQFKYEMFRNFRYLPFPPESPC